MIPTPYGMPKDMPQPETDAKMERCVAARVKAGTPKEQAIPICKAAIIRAHKKGGGH